MTTSNLDTQLDHMRRAAKQLRRGYEMGVPAATERLRAHSPRSDGADLRHADFLHVIAQEQNFASWPAMKLAAETIGLDRAALQQRLKMAVAHGQVTVVQHLLATTPDLADGLLGVQIALFNLAAVKAALWEDANAATRALGPRTPLLHLCFSKWLQARPDLQDDMIAIAELLLGAGADVNDAMPVVPGSDHRLSALYGALGHAGNMPLAAWLLAHGAKPNDGESLYHATELGHAKGVALLLQHGAKPEGTNALLRALDFNDHAMVNLLLAAGADANEFNGQEVGGETPFVIPALHQAARRMCDAKMTDLLLAAGADPKLRYKGASAYGYARVFDNAYLAKAIEARDLAGPLTEVEAQLASAADGNSAPRTDQRFVDPAALPEAYRGIIRDILHLPGKRDHVKCLVDLGLEYDRPDSEGLTPVQVAGWEGLPEMLAYFIQLKPDLGHVNNYGGTLLSTIIHGSENCPQRASRDYLACLEVALTEGVALPRRAIDLAGNEDISAFLADWAEAHPGQVIEGGAR